MKLPKISLFILSLLVLTACTPNNLTINGNKPSPESPKISSPSSNLNFDTIKQNVSQASEKYKNPKWATWRDSAYKMFGRIYINYDKDADKTYVWTTIDGLDKNQTYSVSLIDNQQPDPKNQQLDLGKLNFDQEGKAYLYYEFPEKGSFYSYLKAQVIETGKTEKMLEANFNPRLS